MEGNHNHAIHITFYVCWVGSLSLAWSPALGMIPAWQVYGPVDEGHHRHDVDEGFESPQVEDC